MANFTNHKNNKPLSSELIGEIRRRVDVNGEKKTHVARALGISHSVVRKYTVPDKEFHLSAETKSEAKRWSTRGIAEARSPGFWESTDSP